MKHFVNRLFSHFNALQRLEKQRLALLQNTQLPKELEPALRSTYLCQGQDLRDLPLLVIDFETTGLNIRTDKILSIAAVPIDNTTLHLSGAWHKFVAKQEVKQNTAIINHIVPQMLDNAEPLHEIMTTLFAMMEGRIILAHGANIERGFIQHYLATTYQLSHFPLLWFDTLRLEQTFMKRKQPHYQLNSVRQHYNLPEYIAHNALSDAIATGELFFAQLNYLFGKDKYDFTTVYKRSL